MIDSSSYLSIKLNSGILSDIFSNLEDEFDEVGLEMEINGSYIELSGEEFLAYPPKCKQDIAGCLDIFLGDFDEEALSDFDEKEINKSVESIEWSLADIRGKYSLDPNYIMDIIKKESPETLEQFKTKYSCEGEVLYNKIRDYLTGIDSVTINYLFIYNRNENVEKHTVSLDFE